MIKEVGACIQAAFITFTLLVSATAYAQNKVVVIPLGDSEGVYADIEGAWFGTISSDGGTYHAQWTVLEGAEVGEVSGSASFHALTGATFDCTSVATRVSETGNIYSFREDIIAGTGCALSYTSTLTYNPSNDTITYDAGVETGTLNRVTSFP